MEGRYYVARGVDKAELVVGKRRRISQSTKTGRKDLCERYVQRGPGMLQAACIAVVALGIYSSICVFVVATL